MKKFFGLILIAAALILTSCGANDVAHEKASVEFSIPVADILALQNNVGSKARYGGNEETTFEKILVQIKSDKYYESSLASIPIDSISYDEDGNIRILNDQYLSYYADLEQLAEEYEIPIDIIFSESFVEYLTEYEDLLPKYIEILKNNNLTKTAAIYEETNGEFTQEQGAVMAQEFSSAFVYKDNITFTFDSLEPDEYKVMVDVFDVFTFVEPNSEDVINQVYWTYTGEQSVEVFAGQDNPVTVELEDNSLVEFELFDIEFTYLDDGVEKNRYATYADFGLVDDNPNGMHVEPKYNFIDITDKDNITIGIADEENPSEFIDYPLTRLDLVIKSDSHFTGDGFNFEPVLARDVYNLDPNNYYSSVSNDKLKLTFNDDRIDLLSGFKAVSSDLKDIVQSKYGFELRFPIKISYKGNKSDPSLIIDSALRLPPYDYDSEKLMKSGENTDPNPDPDEGSGDKPTQTGFTETEQGSLLDQNATQEDGGTVTQYLTFNKRESITNKTRYICATSLKSILKDKTLSNGDSVVFVMKIPAKTAEGTEYNLPFSQLQYELQTEDWEVIDDEHLYDNNETINCDTYPAVKDPSDQNDYYTFVLPLNFVQTPQTYNKVLFFFDRDFGGTVTNIPTTLTIPVASLDCYIFPASSKTLVFAVGQTYGDATPSFRYEFKQKMVDNNGDMVNLASGQTVTITLSGTVKYQGSNSSDRITLDGEIFDGAGYYVTSNNKTELSYFHSLSMKNGDNDNTVTPNDGAFTEKDIFKFSPIQAPYWDKAKVEANDELDISNNYQFQCTSTCTDPSVLLIIEGFEMKTSVTE